MAQFYTLEEAATRLSIGPDEFRRRLRTEWTSIRPFRDGPTLRFRAADIDELARSLGAASDPGLPLGPVGSPAAEESGDYAALPADRPLEPRSPAADDRLGPARRGHLRRPRRRANGKPKTKGDSDVRLDLSKPPQPSQTPRPHLPTEEIALDLSGPASGTLKSPSSAKLSAPKSGPKLTGDSGKIPSPSGKKNETDSSSEFELSLDSDSDSFELQLAADSSDEVDIGSTDSGSDAEVRPERHQPGQAVRQRGIAGKEGPQDRPAGEGQEARGNRFGLGRGLRIVARPGRFVRRRGSEGPRAVRRSRPTGTTRPASSS